MICISIYNKQATISPEIIKLAEKPKRSVIVAWLLLAVVMIGLYIFFNGH